MAENILVIGNGFDLYHRLPTRYTDFMFLASEWDKFYDVYDPEQLPPEITRPLISVPLENGRLTQEALKVFGENGYLFNKEHIQYLNDHIKTNSWIAYYQDLHRNEDMRWLDFEADMQDALRYGEEYSMEAIPLNLNRSSDYELPEYLRRIPAYFGTHAKNGYLNFTDPGVVVRREYTNVVALRKNKEKLISFMVDQLDELIRCFGYYLSEFVCHLECGVYSDQIKALQDVNLLNFNYTYTYELVYGRTNLREHFNVHGGVIKDNIVLGIADDAFPDTHDYIRFQKYFQRIQKRTGSEHLKWISDGSENASMPSRNVYVMGHSLGIADFGILGPFFESGSVGRITVFYHSQSAYEDLVINLVKALGKETAVGMISRGRIAFRELEGVRIRCQ